MTCRHDTDMPQPHRRYTTLYEVMSVLFCMSVQDDGRILPKGLDAIISIYDIHRDPLSFPNPNEFDPERFSPKRAASLHPSVFIPFASGLRNCVGM
jgi:cytochrome P450